MQERLTPELRDALIIVLEFCHVAKNRRLLDPILDEMDLADEAFFEALDILERAVG